MTQAPDLMRVGPPWGHSDLSIHDWLIFRMLLRGRMYSLSPAKRMLVSAVPVILLALIFGLVAYFGMKTY